MFYNNTESKLPIVMFSYDKVLVSFCNDSTTFNGNVNHISDEFTLLAYFKFKIRQHFFA